MAEVVTTTVSEKGQLVIPKSIRDKMGLKKGDKLVIAFDNDRLLVEKSARAKKHIVDDFYDLLTASASSLSFWDNETDKAWEHV
ncbi:MAG: AbrB/MazE/SpoVT family DNA-binding domain-containing protein [Candidatus Diapherotrites archaeon]|nr:AbrB/MazE/SpoVT family DNA-binding domain-containing protein [Candidatus Diapherotrites archaeon]